MSSNLKRVYIVKVIVKSFFYHFAMGNLLSHISGRKCTMQSLDSMPATTSLVNARPSMDIKTLAVIQQDGVAQESRVLSLKHKIESGDLASPRKQRILESYSTGDICRIVTMPIKINRQNTDFTSPTARRLYREARKVDTRLAPFSIKRVKLYEPCNATAFIWSLPAEILIAIIALLGSHDL
ncbi:hypothetical protein AZE42_11936 [Rhizopogon vesiculosus]|uniref:Uncharacterized protein n=1 Tax=Rhizopogon vesiculosus TaxID=180088 RepID=A0A1J8R5H6_9AGAM|nr:hypothetical protein AZE42_11936 [Rhizopogon vesiculosus]